MFVLMKTMYLQDLFQINTKIILNLAFANYYCAIFLFIFLVASGEVGGGGGGGCRGETPPTPPPPPPPPQGAEGRPRLPSVDNGQ